jgi:hypothetical protein
VLMQSRVSQWIAISLFPLFWVLPLAFRQTTTFGVNGPAIPPALYERLGVLNGPYRYSNASGNVEDGKPVGTWTFTIQPNGVSFPGVTYTLTIPSDGTVYWAVPYLVANSTCGSSPSMTTEAGQLVNGMKEGVWYWMTCGPTAPLKTAEGSFVHGIPDGEWRFYNAPGARPGSLIASIMFSNGVANGRFMRTCQGGMLTVVGNETGGQGPVDWVCAVAWSQNTGALPSFDSPGSFTGSLKFYGSDGVPIAVFTVSSGSVDVTIPSATSQGSLNYNGTADIDGSPAAQGLLKNGVPDGPWKRFDPHGRVCWITIFSNGKVVGGEQQVSPSCQSPQFVHH